jgi:hypothetical protein
LAGLVALVIGPLSIAGSVSVSVTSPNEVTFVAQNGEENELDSFNTSMITDTGAHLTAGTGCVSLGPNSAHCGLHPNITADLGNRDDTAQLLWNGLVRVWAGSGNDSVLASAFAGAGVAYGEGGDDVLAVVGEGGQLADGGPGDDTLSVSAWGGNSFGYGGPGDDTITFSHAENTASGPVTLDGGGGYDTIRAQPPFSSSLSTISGGAGNDTIEISFPPFFFGPFTISGDGGADGIAAGPGDDIVDGGPGGDYIDVRGGGADTVTCGGGLDVVLHDASDTIADDCETAFLG